jgi:hypothetical protein
MSYVNWTPRSEYRLSDGSKVSGHTNYCTEDLIEVRTDAGEFRTLERAEILSTRKITRI